VSDRYAQLLGTAPGRLLARRVGLPLPARLERHEPGAPVISGAVLLGQASGGRLHAQLRRLLGDIAAPAPIDEQAPVKALLFDASAIADSTQLVELQRFFHPAMRRLTACGRVVVLGVPPHGLEVRHATAQRALEGFTRSLAKELGNGIAVQLVYVAPGAEEEIDSTLRFLLSPRSAYVSGQVISIAPAVAKAAKLDWQRPLAGRLALVTGAARGIGKAIATTLRRDGARLVLLDVPAALDELAQLAAALDAESIALDITDAQAPAGIAERLADGVDIVIHNAGVTRDRTIAKMDEERWSSLLDVNLSSQERIDDELLTRGLVRENGRVVCVSSISGLAGNAGQTNYATSKAGVIGRVTAMAPILAERGATINAVAPGFIETEMTARMPLALREAGRRMNSMSQGGLPVDVAETIAWLASPASGGVNANVVRVCGQSLLGA
jgi:3-oxoacyl-[acyl-carrier protein] reductase